MQIARIEAEPDSVVHVHGRSQNYMGLPVMHKLIFDEASQQVAPSMTTAWSPTPAELEALNKGACVHVELLYLQNPAPMLVTVGPVPREHDDSES